MKSVLLVALTSLVTTMAQAHPLDISFTHQSRSLSLIDTYNNYDQEALETFFDILLNSKSDTLEKSELCIDTKSKAKVFKNFDRFKNQLDAGPFEEIAILAKASDNSQYPIEIELYDMPNETSVAKKTVRFCY